MQASEVSDIIPGLVPGALLVLDPNSLIYLREGSIRRRLFMEALWKAGGAGSYRFAVSAIVWAEALTRPLSQGRHGDATLWRRLLAETSYLEIASVDVAVAEAMAALRAETSLGLADAATLATALVRGAAGLLTNDEGLLEATRSLRGPGPKPRSCNLDELAWRFENCCL